MSKTITIVSVLLCLMSGWALWTAIDTAPIVAGQYYTLSANLFTGAVAISIIQKGINKRITKDK